MGTGTIVEHKNARQAECGDQLHSSFIKQQHRLIDILIDQQTMFIEQLQSTVASQQRTIADLQGSGRGHQYPALQSNTSSHDDSATTQEVFAKADDVKTSYLEKEKKSSRQFFERNFLGNDVFERDLFDEYSFGMSFSTLMFYVLIFHLAIIPLTWVYFYFGASALSDGGWFSWTRTTNAKELDSKKLF